MITVTRLDGVRVLLNHELIETIQQTPDTTVSLINGATLLVRDTPEDMVQRIIDFKQKLVGWSRS